MKISFIISLLLLSSTLTAANANRKLSIFQNTREGSPLYKKIDRGIKTEDDRYIDGDILTNTTYTKRELPKKRQILKAFQKVIMVTNRDQNLCSFKINKRLNEELDLIGINFENNSKPILQLIRDNNLIDDIIYDLLIKSDLRPSGVDSWATTPSLNETDKQSVLSIYKTLEKDLSSTKKNLCLSDTWIAFIRKLSKTVVRDKANTELTKSKIEGLNNFALKKGMISKETFDRIELARKNSVTNWRLTLNQYKEKINFLRNQRPINRKGLSDFVTQKVRKKDISLRQQLFIKYGPEQIILMGSLIEKFAKRLKALRAMLVFEYEDPEDNESIEIQGMDRYRIYVGLLRAEMNALVTHSKFKDKKPTYKEIIVAAFELDIVEAKHLELIAKNEELWNPTKSRMQKWMPWIRTAGVVTSVALPSPWGILVTLGVMAIEISTRNEPKNLEHSLFYNNG